MAGGDITQAIDDAFRDVASQPYTMPRPAGFLWNTKTKHWGEVWAEARTTDDEHLRCGFSGPFMVIAGLEGAMSGVIVADGLNLHADAKAFAADFQSGRVFATLTIGATLWDELVASAKNARGIDADCLSSLRNLSREHGYIGSIKIDRATLANVYRKSGTIAELIARLSILGICESPL